MFYIYVTVSLISCIALIAFGRHVEIVLIATFLPFAHTVYGLTRSKTQADAVARAHIGILLLLCLLNTLLISFRYTTAGFPADISTGSLTALCYIVMFGLTIGLGFAYALTYGSVQGASALLVPYIILGFACFIQLTILYNRNADASQPAIARVQIIAKHVNPIGNLNSSNKIEITPGFDTHTDTSWITVGLPLWDRTHPGDHICFYDYRGALGQAWRKTDICP